MKTEAEMNSAISKPSDYNAIWILASTFCKT